MLRIEVIRPNEFGFMTARKDDKSQFQYVTIKAHEKTI